MTTLKAIVLDADGTQNLLQEYQIVDVTEPKVDAVDGLEYVRVKGLKYKWYADRFGIDALKRRKN